MKVILVQEVKKLGKKGDIIEVSEGYARNYLLPHKLAVAATDANVNAFKQQKEAEARRQQRQLDEARLLASQLAKLSVKVAVKTGEGGKLFGSVTGKDIADALAAQHGLEIDKRKIELKEAIKALGTYPVTIRVHPEVSCQIQVQVTAQ
ncbi:ribosomal protein L9 [Thermosinus carboxydivorans Nor1]|uniref:Large ribosomal subunit protein bL9 n=1 Tax=Thermosinus carboxydivorans Nor1 TaxID=401526 RepID=A1HRJ8_9FIRM|nr:50S ribosomal protein L9 [Thermosinus carboxydivorans]EAX47329.1 ribosomal protein L9 [Thermosinus carboxydivorans Nor1]